MQKIQIFCLIAFFGGAFGANVSISAASLNNPSDIEVKCNEYSSGYCYLNFYGNQTHSRFTPVSNNASLITYVSVNGRIPVLADDICNAFPNLESLYLQVCGIEEILPEAFRKCRKMKILYLSGNNLRVLPKETFRFNQNLETLYLNRCNLKELNPWLFTSLFNLKQLYVYDNYLIEFPAEVVKTNSELRVLNLYRNDLLDLDEVKLREYLPNLSTLYLNNNQISCDRLQQIRNGFQSHGYVSESLYMTMRKRWYLQDTQDSFLCLSGDTWLTVVNQEKALRKKDSSYQVNVSS